jgi:Flp pilus assembly protein TadG
MKSRRKEADWGRTPQHEEGQAIIQVTLSLLVLIGFVALAIDAGNTYSQRRNMQNAADAGALAGARELCLGSSVDTARAAARAYMINNGVAAGAIGAGDIVIAGNTVEVIARENVATTLGSVVAFGAVDVAATAQAACGAATSACGLWPVAFKRSVWQNLYSPAGEVCKPTKIAVWADNNETQQPACTVSGVVQENICNCYDCDEDNNGKDDYAVLVSQGRAWLDFSEAVLPYTDNCTAPGCGASELECHIRNNSGSRITLPTCISGDNGVKAGVKDGVISRAGDNVAIALYDSLGCGTSNCPGGESYRVTSFGCVDVAISPWEQNLQLNPKTQYAALGYKKVKGKIIWANVDCAGRCMTSCGGTDGTVPQPWQLKAVSILR